jgi:hypothetical protein
VRRALPIAALLFGMGLGAPTVEAANTLSTPSPVSGDRQALTPEAINAAPLSAVPVAYAPSAGTTTIRYLPGSAATKGWPNIEYVAGRQLFSLPFSSSSAFSRWASDTSSPPYLAFHL